MYISGTKSAPYRIATSTRLITGLFRSTTTIRTKMPICHGIARLMLRDHDGSGGSRSARPPLFGLPFAGALTAFACVGSSCLVLVDLDLVPLVVDVDELVVVAPVFLAAPLLLARRHRG